MTETSTSKIQAQLRVLLQLTNTEAQVAQVRVAQARTDAVRRELTENGQNAEERARLISTALRELGGYQDVVTPAVGRIAALVKTPLEQIEPLSEALLQDLQLEHQLLDRSRYLLVLAKAAELPRTVALAERLIEAHTATVEWLTTVLAEEALGGPAALAATPLQRVANVATRAAILPNRLAVQGVNRSVYTVQRTVEQARTRFADLGGRAAGLGERAAGFADGAREVLVSGRDASLERAERVARRAGNRQAADAVHETRTDAGALRADELPIKGYDNLTTTTAVAAIKKLTEVEDVRAIIAYEEAHKGRSSVASAAQTRVAAIAKEVAGV
ncbi:MAG TPA: ferritin-like domain-containing protein [Mycobacteriales bacterium]|nr:ferritin-like domain-containing protein [Mycobacteriales bacterium]